jgi:hypothetical protein
MEAFRESKLSKDLRRKIIKESFDWIKKPEISPKYQQPVIRAIAHSHKDFNEVERKEFIHFIIDEVVRKSGKQAHITGAFEVLQDADLKKVLIEGISSLKPVRTNKDNQEYWSWVQQERDGITPIS